MEEMLNLQQFAYIVSLEGDKGEWVGWREGLRVVLKEVVEIILKAQGLCILHENTHGAQDGLTHFMLSLFVPHHQPAKRIVIVKVHVLQGGEERRG